jgi:hypothetical protein
LGERLLCKQEVIGSIPFASTSRAGAAQLAACRWRLAADRDRRLPARRGCAWPSFFDIVKREVVCDLDGS